MVFTFADQDDEMDKEYAADWYKTLTQNIGDMPEISEEQIFLFHGNKNGDNPTSTEEIQQWVESCLPPVE